MTKISAVIITLNEERNIERCIKALESVADEIIVLDAFSVDRTKEICESFNVNFIQRDWEGYAKSKNYLNSLANFEYILSIDADEVLSSKLQKSIADLKKKGLTEVYSVNRLTNYMGKWIKHSGWFPDIKVRLFPKKASRWDGEFVHEELVYDSEKQVVLLEGYLHHYSYYSFEDHRQRADKYSALTAKKQHAAGKHASILKPYLSAIGRFIGMYLIKLGFLDGKMGFKIALISAQSNIFKYKELRRLNREKN